MNHSSDTFAPPHATLSPPRCAVAESPGALAKSRAERERRVKERQRRRLRHQRRRRAMLMLTPLVVALTWYLRPVAVDVEGRQVRAWRGTTVADAVVKADLAVSSGDLTDVRGGVLAAGFGRPPAATANGRPISFAAPARLYRGIAVEPGADLREPTIERATLLPAESRSDAWAPAWQPAYVAAGGDIAGVSRREFGAISGLPVFFDQALALPIATAGATEVGKRLALTFDDGPNGATTEAILEILRANGARATFFVLGDCVARQADLLRRQVAEGHEIGNHSWGHPVMSRMSVSAAMASVARAEAAIEAETGVRCRWFRPPYGETTKALRRTLMEAGYSIALWSVDTEDWQRPGSSVIYDRIMRGAEAGAIILMHDGGERSQTVAAVERAVPHLLDRGYELVTMSELKSSLPGGDAGIALTTHEGTLRAHVPANPIRVFAWGRELSPLEPLLVAEGTVLLPAPAVLEALGAKWEWDREAQTVTVSSLRGRFRLRLDSHRVQWDERDVRVDVPPILYHDVPLAPARLLARVAGAQLDESQAPEVLSYSFLEPVYPTAPR